MKRGLDYVDVDGGTAESSSNVDVEAALLSATSMGTHVFRHRMPWEATPLMRSVFGCSRVPWIGNVKVPRTFPAVPAASGATPGLTAIERKIAIRESTIKHLGKRGDLARDTILMKWLEVLLMLPDQSRVGKQLTETDVQLAAPGKHLQIVADSLQKKSTRTLSLRVSSLLLFIRWHAKHSPNDEFLPFREPVVYDYLCSIRDAACSASRGTTFISTLAFCKDVLGMSGAEQCITSARNSGAALAMFLTKRPLKQAPPLSPDMLAVLEIASVCDADVYNRCVAGFCLCCIFGRMRVSDMNRLANLAVRGDFAEGSLMRVKTARSREKQTTFLPCVMPCHGLLGLDWFRAFTFNRKLLGLEDFPDLGKGDAKDSFLVLPSEGSLLTVNFENISTSEVTNRLRVLLGKIYDASTVGGITSHSMKTTVLTYLGIMGCDFTYTELLGYHLTQHRSAINYQRDALSAPIRLMCEMLGKVKTGEFVPLAHRNDVFPEYADRLCIVDQVLHKTGLHLQSVVETFLGCSLDELYKDGVDRNRRMLFEMLAHTESFNGTVEGLTLTPADPGKDQGECADAWEILSSPPSVDATFNADAGGESDGSLRDDDTDSCSSSAESALVALVKDSDPTYRLQSRHAMPDVLYRHKRTKMIHMEHVDSSSKTACGRVLGGTYERFYGDVDKAWPHCSHCFGNLCP